MDSFYYGRVILLTGASSGIGKAAAEHLASLVAGYMELPGEQKAESRFYG